MKSVVEAYAGLWVLLLLMWIGIAFTTINLNVSQARKTYNDIKAEIQASNGNFELFKNKHGGTIVGNTYQSERYDGSGFYYTFTIENKDINRQYQAEGETYIYNDLLQLSMTYTYAVPILGVFTYPQIGYVY